MMSANTALPMNILQISLADCLLDPLCHFSFYPENLFIIYTIKGHNALITKKPPNLFLGPIEFRKLNQNPLERFLVLSQGLHFTVTYFYSLSAGEHRDPPSDGNSILKKNTFYRTPSDCFLVWSEKSSSLDKN